MSSFAEREEAPFNPHGQRFTMPKKSFASQYSHLYNLRLKSMKDKIRLLALRQWGSEVRIMNNIIDSEIVVSDVIEENAKAIGSSTRSSPGKPFSPSELLGDVPECILIGTLCKQMPKRPSVLDEYKDATMFQPSKCVDNFVISSEEDSLVLEDETGRIALSGEIENLIGSLVTGVVVAVKGKEKSLGDFHVSDWLFIGGSSLEDVSPVCSSMQLEQAGPYVLLVSGLRIGSPHSSPLSTNLLVDFVSGRIGDDADMELARKISRVVIVGDSIAASESTAENRKQHCDTVSACNQFDLLLSQLLSSCPVVLMPGQSDPVVTTLPQEPLHPCLFPHSSRFSTLQLISNPAQFAINEKLFVGHAGQPINDIVRQTRKTEVAPEAMDGDSAPKFITLRPIEALENTLLWGHLAPTCPDTLGCYPFTEADVLITDPIETLDVVFAGNQDCFETKLVASRLSQGDHSTRLISIPSFSTTGQVVLVDVGHPSLPCHAISFEGMSIDETVMLCSSEI